MNVRLVIDVGSRSRSRSTYFIRKTTNMSRLAVIDENCSNNRTIPHKIPAEKFASLKKNIFYSEKYSDDEFEFRHVMVPKEISKWVPKHHFMSESEWRSLGIQQSQGWVHYMRHNPEPHILLFRRKLPKNN